MPRHPQAVGTLADLYLDSAGPAGAILSEQDVQQARDYWYDDASNDPGQMPTVMCLFTDSTKRRENSSPQTRDPEPCFFLARATWSRFLGWHSSVRSSSHGATARVRSEAPASSSGRRLLGCFHRDIILHFRRPCFSEAVPLMLVRTSAQSSEAFWTVHKRGEDSIKIAEEALS